MSRKNLTPYEKRLRRAVEREQAEHRFWKDMVNLYATEEDIQIMYKRLHNLLVEKKLKKP